MSMYTELLDAALHQVPIDGLGEEERGAVAEAQRCRSQLERGAADVDPDMVSAALALQIAYDVALLRLAGLVGIESDPYRFDRPYDERTRLEGELTQRGISLATTAPALSPSPGRAAWRDPQVPVASERAT
jgi:hypothetical protein